MNKEQAIRSMTSTMSKFVSFVEKKLSDDVEEKLADLHAKETEKLAKTIYDNMLKNQKLAIELDRPCCQDTGIQQFFVKCGVHFPLIGEIEAILTDAILDATASTPLRPNSVETFDEYNTGNNVGTGTPGILWEIVPDSDTVEIGVYMAGGGCMLPGRSGALMPSDGYEGIVKYVLDTITSYGLNACPPLMVGVGVANSSDAAAALAKKAMLRPIGSHNPNEKAAKMERLLEDGINKIGFGPQGICGDNSVMGVNIENSARHPAAIGVAVNVGCWSLRKGNIIFDREMNYTVTSHKGAVL